MKAQPLLLLVAIAFSVPANGAEINVSLDIRLGKVLPPPPPEVVVVEKAPARPGPPPWAPAHGARRNRDYYYYPGADVYFRPEDRLWFYLEGGNWRFGASLPTAIRIDFARAVPLNMATDKPHEFHDAVRREYPADYFVTKVKVKEPPGHSGDGKPGHADDDSPGKGRGRGKNK